MSRGERIRPRSDDEPDCALCWGVTRGFREPTAHDCAGYATPPPDPRPSPNLPASETLAEICGCFLDPCTQRQGFRNYRKAHPYASDETFRRHVRRLRSVGSLLVHAARVGSPLLICSDNHWTGIEILEDQLYCRQNHKAA